MVDHADHMLQTKNYMKYITYKSIQDDSSSMLAPMFSFNNEFIQTQIFKYTYTHYTQ